MSLITQVRKHATYAHLHILYATFLFICNAVGKKRVLSHIKIKKKYARYRKIRPSLSGLMKVLEKKQLLHRAMKRGTHVTLNMFDLYSMVPPTLHCHPL